MFLSYYVSHHHISAVCDYSIYCILGKSKTAADRGGDSVIDRPRIFFILYKKTLF
jgi:hypothetical protein